MEEKASSTCPKTILAEAIATKRKKYFFIIFYLNSLQNVSTQT
jgi:hypothetical protein